MTEFQPIAQFGKEGDFVKRVVSGSECQNQMQTDFYDSSYYRLKIKIDGLETYDTVVARDRYRNFTEWLDR